MAYTGSTCQEIQDKVAAMVLARPLATTSAMSDALLVGAVNWTIREIQRRHDWQAMRTTDEGLTTEAGTPYVELPSTYKKMAPGYEENGSVFRLEGQEWVQVPMVYDGQLLDLVRLRRMYRDPTDADEPRYCCIEGRRLYFGPTPNDAYGLRLVCLSFTSDLSAGDRNWFTENLEEAIVEGGTARACFWIHQEAEARRRFARFGQLVDEAFAVDAAEPAARTGPRSAILRGEVA